MATTCNLSIVIVQMGGLEGVTVNSNSTSDGDSCDWFVTFTGTPGNQDQVQYRIQCCNNGNLVPHMCTSRSDFAAGTAVAFSVPLFVSYRKKS